MRDDEADRVERMVNAGVDQTIPTAAEQTRALGLWGAIQSFRRRMAGRMATKQLEETEQAFRAGARVARAQEDFRRATARISGQALSQIAEQERDQVEIEVKTTKLNLAEVNEKTEAFSDEAEIRKEERAARLARARKEARDAKRDLAGDTSNNPGPAGPTEEELRQQLADLEEERETLDEEMRTRQASGTLDETWRRTYNRKYNNLSQRIDELEAQILAL